MFDICWSMLFVPTHWDSYENRIIRACGASRGSMS